MKKVVFVLVICSSTVLPETFLASPTVFPTGTTIYKPEKAWNGYTIFPAKGIGPVLIDMNGNVVKQWLHPSYASMPKILPGGHVMRPIGGSGRIKDHPTANDLVQLDWDGNVVWKFEKAGQHHDYQREGNPVGYYVPGMDPLTDKGKTLILSKKFLKNPEITDKLLYEDYLFEVTWDGKIVWEWLWHEHFDELGFDEAAKNALYRNPNYEPINTEGEKAAKWLHINSVSYLGPNKWYDAGDERFHPDNVIWDSRQSNILGITDRKTGKIVWRVGPDYDATPALRELGQVVGPHHCHMIPRGLPGAGNILLFDNGGQAGYGSPNPGSDTGMGNARRDYSRVIEFDPVTLEVVWEYTAGKAGYRNEKFYSINVSSAQRLPNGNTLITEGAQGRFFEVTPELEIVWEYVNPFFHGVLCRTCNNPHDWIETTGETEERRNTAYRSYRVPYEWVPQLELPEEKAVIPPPNSKFKIEPQ